MSRVPVVPRLAVLDMVGTTVVAGREVPDAFVEAFRRAGVVISPDAVNAVRGRSKAEAIAELVAAHLPDIDDPGQVSEAIHADFRSILRTLYETEAKPVPGAGDAVAELIGLGVSVALTTGLDRETATGLVRGLGWDSVGLLGVVTGDDVTRGRPEPDLIYAAMALVPLDDPAAVLVVGDTISDLQAAARAQVGWSIGVLSGAHSAAQLQRVPHSAILTSVAALPDWLKEVGAGR